MLGGLTVNNGNIVFNEVPNEIIDGGMDLVRARMKALAEAAAESEAAALADA